MSLVKSLRHVIGSLILVVIFSATALAETIFVEAESFREKGGWVVDQQFMDQMGSPFLLAHGMGEPVKDATTTITVKQAGQFRVFVRTRDWVAPHGPGRFNLLIDNRPLDTKFGANIGDRWTWQAGGDVTLGQGSVTLALHDLSGFDGRCDAIVLTDDKDFAPPTDLKELAAFRKKALGLPDEPPDAGEYDLVIVGGGVAGTCAAVSAARMGLTVALVQDRPVLGGNGSSEVRVHPDGKIGGGPYPRLADIVNEVALSKMKNAAPAEDYQDQKKLEIVANERNITLMLNMHANRVVKSGDRIAAVVAVNVLDGREAKIRGKLFADCTGDGTIGFLAGADYRVGREGRDETGESLAPPKADKVTMGTSNMWYAKKLDAPAAFPECPWALQFNDKTCYRQTKGDWDWESGTTRDTIGEAELIRDHNFRAVYGNWAFLKNHTKDYADWKLDWVAYIGGKRESRRLMGDVIVSQHDMVDKKVYPDGCVITGWHIDLHFPTEQQKKNFPGEEFRTMVGKAVPIEPFLVPYRCFYSRNVGNLFMAGRNISVTHVAFGSVRVQKTTGMMGVVVGRAAYLCRKYDISPRQVYAEHLEELKQTLNQPGKPR